MKVQIGFITGAILGSVAGPLGLIVFSLIGTAIAGGFSNRKPKKSMKRSNNVIIFPKRKRSWLADEITSSIKATHRSIGIDTSGMINPATGLPMIDGVVDTSGNTYGSGGDDSFLNSNSDLISCNSTSLSSFDFDPFS